jgi:sugar lactone lactonase YvrE
MSQPLVVLDGLGFPESTRWHEGRVWTCNWGSGEILVATPDGQSEVVASLPAQTIPFSIDWLPDGRMLVVDGPKRALLVHEPDEGFRVVADLSSYGPAPFNELVVDRIGNAYVNGGPGLVVCVAVGGEVRQVAEGLLWPNGMAITEDGRTLIVADSHAETLLAFRVESDGSWTPQGVWADLEHAPDGICLDQDGAVWVASVPGRRCTRVRQGGEVLDEVAVDRGCFACMLGGQDGRTLFIGAAEWRGMEVAMQEGPGNTGLLLAAPGQPTAHAGRP